jgi:ATP-dependent protease ClpP protease subunit
MHTPGGNWCDGLAIIDSMKLLSNPITILAYAQASSMSGVILQGADNRILMPRSEFLVHHGNITVTDNSLTAKSIMESNNRSMEKMLQIFSQRALKTSKFFKEKRWSEKNIMVFIDKKIKESGDWYLTPEEAVYYGFADGIFGDKGFESIESIRIDKKAPI